MPYALAAITLLGGVLRFATLDLQSFWLDEAVTVELVRLGLPDMLHRIPESESTPPLYYLLAWAWSRPFGSGEVGLRSLSALVGTASVPVAFAAARELCSRRVGLAVAALAAVSPVLVWYSQEGRAYALLVLLGALVLWAFARLLRRPGGRAAVAWGAASALALGSHYFAVFLVVPMAIWLAVRPATRRVVLPATLFVAATALALLPLAIHQRSLDFASFISDDSLPLRLARSGKSFLLGFESPLETALTVAAGAIAVAGAAAALRTARGQERAGVHIALALGALAVALPLALAVLGVDYFDARNLLAAWLPLMTVVAAGLAASRLGLAGLGALCAMGLASVVGVALEPTWQRDDWRGMAEALGPASLPRVLVVQPASGRRPLEVYLPELAPLTGAGTRTEEIASMHPVRREAGEDHPAPPPRPSPPLVAGFSLTRRALEPTFSLYVQRASPPQRIGVPEGNSVRLDRAEAPAVLLQRPSERGRRAAAPR